MFRNLKGFDGFSLVDGLTRTREMQKFALGFECADGEAIANYAKRLSAGPGPTVKVEDAW